MNTIFFCFSLFMGIGCDKNDYPTPAPVPYPCLYGACDTSKLNLIWQRPLNSDTSDRSSQMPVIFKDYVVFTGGLADETMSMLDAKTGNQIWDWKDYLIKDNNNTLSGNGANSKGILLKNDNLLLNTGNEIYCVNANNGQTVWTNEVPSRTGHPHFTIIGDDVYHIHEKIVNKSYISSTLVKRNINNGTWLSVFKQDSIGKYESSLEMPTLWTAANGHDILIFQARFINFSDLSGKADRVDVVAYDTKDQQEYFRFENIDNYNHGSTKLPFVLNDKAYIALQQKVVCIDMLTKSILWQKDFGSGGNFSSGQPFMFVENKFFVKPDDRRLYQLDPNTGAEIWVDRDNGSGCSDMVYHNGLLYYTCSGNGKIYAIEVATGNKIWAEPSPNKFPNKMNGNRRRSSANIGAGGVAINPTLGYLYTSDYYFGMCLKLPK